MHRIITWNVNGLRAAFGKGAWDWLASQEPDAICLQEIKTQPGQLSAAQRLALEPYQSIWHPAERLGYSGVATFLKNDPLSYAIGVGNPAFDTEGRVVESHHTGFRVFNIYFPSGQRGVGRVAYKLDFYACLLKLFDRLHAAGEKLVVCGDFNTAHQEIDLRHPKANRMTSGFLPEERAWIDRYLEHGFIDAFRALYPERVAYTWWTYRMNAREKNVGWRLDYFLVSKALMPAVRDVLIHPEITGSDHCPVTLLLHEMGDTMQNQPQPG
ncbi:MAG TPA: exodeoxyribonuclease III [Anaerolineales bacterium]|nr:exodeoxyribonuclease III [Anaerolineales bacterium]